MIKLSKPYIPEETLGSMMQVLQSGNLVQGANVLAFEAALQEYLGVAHVVLVSSGTAALHVSLVALGIGLGDEVIVPAYSFPAVANAVELAGAKPVFVDICTGDYCIDADKIERKITLRTKAIMPVHEFGQAADMDKIWEIASGRGLYVVEDAACAIGTRYNHVHAGTMGDLGCFSFHPRKILTTGEGGAVVTHNPDLAGKVRKLRNHGMEPAGKRFDFVLPGFNYRMTDFQAAMGVPQLNALDETIGIHRAQGEYYNRAFAGVQGITLDSDYENRFKTYQTYHILLSSEQIRDKVKEELYKKGIESNIGAYAIPFLSYYSEKYKLAPGEFANARTAFSRGLALPVGRHLKEGDLEYITNSVKEIIGHGL